MSVYVYYWERAELPGAGCADVPCLLPDTPVSCLFDDADEGDCVYGRGFSVRSADLV